MHKEYLNEHKVKILKRMAKYAVTHGNEVPLSILKDNVTDYNNAQKLRYHALIYKRKRGIWGITLHGWEFLKGERELPKYVIVHGNKLVGRSEKTVSISDLLQKEPTPETRFEYVNKEGETIAVRPDGFTPQAKLL